MRCDAHGSQRTTSGPAGVYSHRVSVVSIAVKQSLFTAASSHGLRRESVALAVALKLRSSESRFPKVDKPRMDRMRANRKVINSATTRFSLFHLSSLLLL
jgi:hypothetical protein